jgi:hypothetical protein
MNLLELRSSCHRHTAITLYSDNMGTAEVKGKLEAWEQSNAKLELPRALGFRPSGVSDKVVGMLRVVSPGVERNIAILDILGEHVPLIGCLAMTVVFTAAVMMVVVCGPFPV